MFLNKFGPIYLIYYLENSRMKNITLNYYSGIGLNKYNSGHYFCKVIDSNRTNHLIHSGEITDITIKTNNNEIEYPKRKNIMLLHNNEPVQCDLDVLDNYVHNMRLHNKKHSLQTKDIFNCLGLNCTEIQFTTLRPRFTKEIHPIDKISIDDLHY